IVYTDNGKYAANIEMTPAPDEDLTRLASQQQMQTVDTPKQHTIEEVSQFLKVPADRCLKTLIVKGDNDDLIALVLRGDHELNKVKAEKLERSEERRVG